MDEKSQKRKMIFFLWGAINKNVDNFCIYQWIDRCYFQGWWDLGIQLASHIPPNSLPIEYQKRLNYLLSVCREKYGDSNNKIVKHGDEGPDIRMRFWQLLLDKANAREGFFKNAEISSSSWIGETIDEKKTGYYCNITDNIGWIELIIDEGPNSKKINKSLFGDLFSHKDEIEKKFGEPLRWELMGSCRRSLIKKNLEAGGLQDSELWEEIQTEMIEAMGRFEKAINPFLTTNRFLENKITG